MTTEVFAKTGTDWIATAQNPETGKLNTAMIDQPMLELIDYLETNGLEVFVRKFVGKRPTRIAGKGRTDQTP